MSTTEEPTTIDSTPVDTETVTADIAIESPVDNTNQEVSNDAVEVTTDGTGSELPVAADVEKPASDESSTSATETSADPVDETTEDGFVIVGTDTPVDTTSPVTEEEAKPVAVDPVEAPSSEEPAVVEEPTVAPEEVTTTAEETPIVVECKATEEVSTVDDKVEETAPVDKVTEEVIVVDNSPEADKEESPKEEKTTTPTPVVAAAPAAVPAAKTWSSDFTTNNNTVPSKPEAKTWSSDFTTNNNTTATASSSAAAKPAWKSDFTTNTTTPAPVSVASKPTTTSQDNVVKVSSIHERSSTFASANPTIPTPSSSTSSGASTLSRERSGTIQNLATKFNNNPAITGGYNPSTPRSSVAASQRNLPSHVQKSGYIQQSGVRQGSLASFVGNALGVQHKGEHTGLVRNRYDADEERARLEHRNRGANKNMALVMERAVSEAKTSKETGTPQSGSIAYLARKLESAQVDK